MGRMEHFVLKKCEEKNSFSVDNKNKSVGIYFSFPREKILSCKVGIAK